MDHLELQHLLRTDIENLQRLHDRLSDDGKPLSPADKQTIRDQLSGNWLRSMHSEQKMFFMEGSMKDVLKNAEHITTIMEQFS